MVRYKKATGRPFAEGFGFIVTGANETLEFLKDAPKLLDDFMENLVEKTAIQMMGTGREGSMARRLSIKSPKYEWIPRDTGRLRAVFGAVDGKPNTGLIRDWARALAKSPKPLEADVIWEKYGRFTYVMGTDLYYAAVTIKRADWLGVYLRSIEQALTAYVQGRFNVFFKQIEKDYNLK